MMWGMTMPNSVYVGGEILQRQFCQRVFCGLINVKGALVGADFRRIPRRNSWEPSLPPSSASSPLKFQRIAQSRAKGGPDKRVSNPLNAPRKHHRPVRAVIHMKILASNQFLRVNNLTIRNVCLAEIFAAKACDEVRSFCPGNEVS